MQNAEWAELKRVISYFLDGFENATGGLESTQFAKTLGKIRRELGGDRVITVDPFTGGNYLFSVETEFDLLDVVNGVRLPKYKLQVRTQLWNITEKTNDSIIFV